MQQKILHCTDTTKLPEQLTEAGHYHTNLDTDGNEIKTPYLPVEAEGMTIEINGQSLICTLITTEQEPGITAITSLSILGTYDEIFADSEKLAIYDSIYDRSEQTITDPETGEEYTYQPPDHFAEFALPKPDTDELQKQKETQRNKMLADTFPFVQTFDEQTKLGIQTDISEQQYKETLQFRDSLRKM